MQHLPVPALVARLVLALCALSCAAAMAAPDAKKPPLVTVEGAWVRSTTPSQQGTGGFMKLTASQPMTLVGVETPLAGVAEVHEMKMQGDLMKMRAVPALALPAGKTVELKPGGYHLMLMDLKHALAPGSTMPLTLLLRDAGGIESRVEIKVPVAVRAPATATVPADNQKH